MSNKKYWIDNVSEWKYNENVTWSYKTWIAALCHPITISLYPKLLTLNTIAPNVLCFLFLLFAYVLLTVTVILHVNTPKKESKTIMIGRMDTGIPYTISGRYRRPFFSAII